MDVDEGDLFQEITTEIDETFQIEEAHRSLSPGLERVVRAACLDPRWASSRQILRSAVLAFGWEDDEVFAEGGEQWCAARATALALSELRAQSAVKAKQWLNDLQGPSATLAAPTSGSLVSASGQKQHDSVEHKLPLEAARLVQIELPSEGDKETQLASTLVELLRCHLEHSTKKMVVSKCSESQVPRFLELLHRSFVPTQWVPSAAPSAPGLDGKRIVLNKCQP